MLSANKCGESVVENNMITYKYASNRDEMKANSLPGYLSLQSASQSRLAAAGDTRYHVLQSLRPNQRTVVIQSIFL